MKLYRLGGAITKPRGFKAGGLSAGIKKDGSLDLSLILSEKDSNAAVLFTRNKVKAWPVLYGIEQMKRGHSIRAVLINSGNANCCNGKSGMKAVEDCVKALSEELNISSEKVFVSSTGVIGVNFSNSAEKIIDAIPKLAKNISEGSGQRAAEGILTTDTVTKEAVVEFYFGMKKITIGAMAKGAGMIHPNMGTMLVYFTTDCAVSADMLKDALKEVAAETFNRMSVDNDTSTNDTVLILANGMAGNKYIDGKNRSYNKFRKALFLLSDYMRKLIIADGEGVTKVCEINVVGAVSDKDADVVSRTVANSMLFKTAVAGADPNWGRIIAAVGRSGAGFDENKMGIYFSNLPVYKNGKVYAENIESIRNLLEQRYVFLKIDLGIGKGKAVFITSDLTAEYVRINSEYTT